MAGKRPELPYAEALRELTAIAQGFSKDPTIVLVQEHNACRESKHWSKILADASDSPERRYQREDVDFLFPPPGILPPLI